MFAFCVEGSHSRGMGHVFRALALAETLERRGAKTHFVVDPDAAVRSILAKRGRTADETALAHTSAGWEASLISKHGVRVWIDDRLDTDHRHAETVTAAGVRLVTFDDRGPGARLADLNVCALAQDHDLPGKRVLTGLRYLVLDPRVEGLRRVRTAVRSRIVSMGGSDTYGLTVEVVRALKAARLPAIVVLGPAFAHEAQLEAVLDENFTLRRGVESLPEELSRHDLAITAGGITAFEAGAQGLPCIIVAAEPWERDAAQLLEACGAAAYAGYRAAFDRDMLSRSFAVERMSRAGLQTLDGKGAERVANEILAL